MRLWHKDLIKILPNKQLFGQWRECCLIARNINLYGKPMHILVNKVVDYPVEHFYRYAQEVASEIQRRGHKADIDCFYSFFTTDDVRSVSMPTHDEMFAGWHNQRYMEQCYYNLQEKYDCGGITDDEWSLIERFKEKK